MVLWVSTSYIVSDETRNKVHSCESIDNSKPFLTREACMTLCSLFMQAAHHTTSAHLGVTRGFRGTSPVRVGYTNPHVCPSL